MLYVRPVLFVGVAFVRTQGQRHTRTFVLSRTPSGSGISPSQRSVPVQHTTLTTDKEPCAWRDSNPQSQRPQT
jgi:hypothetical protein